MGARFSANLGMLFHDLPLVDAVHAARFAGFDAVEAHWPYATPAADLRAALGDMPLISLNSPTGDRSAGEFGLAGVPGRGWAGVQQAIDYAQQAGAQAVHVMAGRSGAETACFERVLAQACDAAPHLTMLIEPLNQFDVPGYLLNRLDQAAEIVGRVGRNNLKVMFDFYHIARIHGDVSSQFARYRAIIGHIQFAAVPDRSEPDHGVLNFAEILPPLGWDGHFGAEYHPRGTTQQGLGWLPHLRAAF